MASHVGVRSKLDWLQHLRGVDVSPTEFRVLVTLSTYADKDGTNAWPSIRTLAQNCCSSERRVQRALRALEVAGLIEVTKPGGNGQGCSTTYALAMPSKGGTPVTLADAPESPKGDTGVTLASALKGDAGDAKGGNHGAGRVTPASPDQVLTPGPRTIPNSRGWRRRSWQGATPEATFGPPKAREACEIHGSWKSNCGGCRADQLASTMPRVRQGSQAPNAAAYAAQCRAKLLEHRKAS